MTFDQALKYLDDLGEPRMNLDLAASRAMLERLGRPDRRFASVIVAGTNGKGSTCAMLSAMADAAGMKVGTFTSPHLESVTERIAIGCQAVEEELFAEAASLVRAALDSSPPFRPTYFEFVTMMAALIFSRADVDLAIVEVGLGGRLDATNSLERVAVGITHIHFDHTAILGNTLSAIAREKGAVMRRGLPAVIAAQPEEAALALRAEGRQLGAGLVFADEEFSALSEGDLTTLEGRRLSLQGLRLACRGRHQASNAACAATLALELREKGFDFTAGAVRAGIETGRLPARLDLWSDGTHDVWLDVAHNPSAAEATALFFSGPGRPPRSLVLGMLKDKDWQAVLDRLAPLASHVTLCRPGSPRALEPKEAAARLSSSHITAVVDDAAEALAEALKGPGPVLCTGSTYIMAPILRFLRDRGFENR